MAETETTTTTPAPTVKLKAGREWTVEAMGVRSLKREYVVVLNAPTGADGEGAIPGLPAIGSKHPNMDGLKVTKHTVTEGSGPDKNTLKVVVEYAAETTTSTVEEETATVDGSVTEWGWDSGTAQKELVTDVNGEAVVNSAGDPFQTAPTFSAYAPTFTKVIKCGTRKAGALAYNCKVNASSVTIGGTSYAAKTLLCSVAEKRIWGEMDYNYQYTINFKYMSNMVCVGNSGEPEEIGWDVAVVDAGMRERDEENGGLKIITRPSSETNELASVTSAELLDGEGHAVVRTSQQDDIHPFVLAFAAYETANFPMWFYSEPNLMDGTNP